jgi:hypothetical protein
LGLITSTEHKRKISEANRGKTRNKGKTPSDETKQKLRAALIGKKRPDEARKHISEALRGKAHPVSKEGRERITAGLRQYYQRKKKAREENAT